ncbi:MAG: ABC transporter permease, partial [Myxococcales bacterium]
MWSYALRRVLWAIPTLFGISLVVFVITTLIPTPDHATLPATVDETSLSEYLARQDGWRRRFLDLPHLFNHDPDDVRSRAERCLAVLERPAAHTAAERVLATRRLIELGGAALPIVLPRLEALGPETRSRLARALAPLAERMGLERASELADPALAVHFWTHFWEDRSLDFTEPAARRTLDRYVEHGTEMRARDLRLLDTFALSPLMTRLRTDALPEHLARITRSLAHATGQGQILTETDGPVRIRRVVAEWEEWWYVHQTDYVPLDGAIRIAATVRETRYGKWVLRGATGQLGLSPSDGEPVVDKLRLRAPITVLLTATSLLVSYALAIPIGILGALRRGKELDIVTSAGLFLLYSLPSFFLATLLREAFKGGLAHDTNLGYDRLILPIAALSLGSLATLSRYQRSALLDVLSQDYMRTARAKGVSRVREVLVHALRNALLPTVTLAGLQVPTMLGGAFVVEEVFHLPGLGYETLRAVETHNTSWLV